MRQLSAIVALTALLSPSAARADDLTTCQRLLTTLEATDATNELQGDDGSTAIMRTHPSSRFAKTGVYKEVAEQITGWSRETLVGTMRCDGDDLVIEGSIDEEEGVIGERYDPPLVWLRFPMETGSTWTWTGTMTVGPRELPITSKASARGTVIGVEEVETLAGTVQATHVALEMVLQANATADAQTEGRSIRVDSWVQLEPVYWVVKRRLSSGQDAFPPHEVVMTRAAPR